jgi:hypothetical protein
MATMFVAEAGTVLCDPQATTVWSDRKARPW